MYAVDHAKTDALRTHVRESLLQNGWAAADIDAALGPWTVHVRVYPSKVQPYITGPGPTFHSCARFVRHLLAAAAPAAPAAPVPPNRVVQLLQLMTPNELQEIGRVDFHNAGGVIASVDVRVILKLPTGNLLQYLTVDIGMLGDAMRDLVRKAMVDALVLAYPDAGYLPIRHLSPALHATQFLQETVLDVSNGVALVVYRFDGPALARLGVHVQHYCSLFGLQRDVSVHGAIGPPVVQPLLRSLPATVNVGLF